MTTPITHGLDLRNVHSLTTACGHDFDDATVGDDCLVGPQELQLITCAACLRALSKGDA